MFDACSNKTASKSCVARSGKLKENYVIGLPVSGLYYFFIVQTNFPHFQSLQEDFFKKKKEGRRQGNQFSFYNEEHVLYIQSPS